MLHLVAATWAMTVALTVAPVTKGVPSLHGVAVRDHQHLVERFLCADVGRHLFYFEFFAGGDAVLLAAGFDDRVHVARSLFLLKLRTGTFYRVLVKEPECIWRFRRLQVKDLPC